MDTSFLNKIKDWKSKVTAARGVGVTVLPCPTAHHSIDGYCCRCGNAGRLRDVKPKILSEEQKRQARAIVELLLELSCGFDNREELSLQDTANFLASKSVIAE